jgi:hypothetical protein
MRAQLDDSWLRSTPHGRAELSRPTLLVLLAAVAVPALMVALALGWRPVDPAVFAPLGEAIAALRPPAAAPARTPGADWATADGWFYTQLAPSAGASDSRLGYAVTDQEGKPFWSEFQRLGGVAMLGYPLSRRYEGEGATYQAFQRGILRYDGPTGTMSVVPILDNLHAAQLDDTLTSTAGIPALALPRRTGVESAGVRADWLLADYPAIQAYLTAAPDARAVLGVPTSTVQDFGPYYAVRFQNGALQQWKVDVPWARKGEVTAVNAGEIAARHGQIPAEALAPAAAPAEAPRPAPAGAVASR